MITTVLIAILIAVLISLIRKLFEMTKNFEKQNIKFVKPLPLFGNTLQNFLGMKHQSEIIEKCYSTFSNEDFFGYFSYTVPQLVIRNANLVERIMVRDFPYFCDRQLRDGPVKTPAESTLLNLCGLQWRVVRNKFTPLFTSSKLKYMFQSIGEVGKKLDELFNENDGKVLDMTDIMSSYSLEVIGSTAYGIDFNTLKNPRSEFRSMADKLVNMNLLFQIRLLLLVAAPRFLSMLGLSRGFITDNTANYFCDIISDAFEQRKKSGQERPDFIQLMVTLKEKGSVEIQTHDSVDDYLKVDKTVDNQAVEITDEIIIGGGFTFIFAGFHSSAMTIVYTLYEMARHPDVLKKVRSEVQGICSDGCVTYDNLKSMKYMENVIKEALRLYPLVSVINRVCTKEYTMPGGQIIKPGQSIVIPVSALHKDPNYHQDPMVFNPDRFEASPIPGSYLPFGDGPRICIGMRLAMMEVKYCIAKLILKYNIELVDPLEQGLLKMEPRFFLTTPVCPIKMRIYKL